MVPLSKFLTNDRCMLLAYDHGVEHGPKDFNLQNVDPETIMSIALEGKYDGLAIHHGLAEKYYHGPFKEIPLVIKLNGKTNIPHIDPISRQICSVERAVKLGASAVGYTIYDGSPAETEMFQEFGKIVEQAHDYGLPVIVWMYPRGPDVVNDESTDILAYSTRLALEMGADMVKIKYNDDRQGFEWVVKSAGRCRVLIAGGGRVDDRDFLESVKEAMDAGCTGLAVGRNVWGHPKPFSMTEAIAAIVRKNKTVEQALTHLR